MQVYKHIFGDRTSFLALVPSLFERLVGKPTVDFEDGLVFVPVNNLQVLNNQKFLKIGKSVSFNTFVSRSTTCLLARVKGTIKRAPLPTGIVAHQDRTNVWIDLNGVESALKTKNRNLLAGWDNLKRQVDSSRSDVIKLASRLELFTGLMKANNTPDKEIAKLTDLIESRNETLAHKWTLIGEIFAVSNLDRSGAKDRIVKLWTDALHQVSYRNTKILSEAFEALTDQDDIVNPIKLNVDEVLVVGKNNWSRFIKSGLDRRFESVLILDIRSQDAKSAFKQFVG